MAKVTQINIGTKFWYQNSYWEVTLLGEGGVCGCRNLTTKQSCPFKIETVLSCDVYESKSGPKTLTQQEINQIRDLICEATLHKEAEHKQYFLIEVGGILSGSKKEFLESAESQGYNISKGKKP